MPENDAQTQDSGDADTGITDSGEQHSDTGIADASMFEDGSAEPTTSPNHVALELNLTLTIDGSEQTKTVMFDSDLVDRRVAECDEPALTAQSAISGGGPMYTILIATRIAFCDDSLTIEGIDGPELTLHLLVPLDTYQGIIEWDVQHTLTGSLSQSGSFWRYRFSDARIEITEWKKNGEQVIADGTLAAELQLYCQGTEEECARYGATADLSGSYQLSFTPSS